MKKALSIRQPWAWLIAHGYKDIENRTWHTNFKGNFYIHSPLKVDDLAYEIFKATNIPVPNIEQLKTGGIVGKATIIDCVTESKSPWFQGPYGFIISNPKPIKFTKVRGNQLFFSF